jgi:hypothetical protein
MEGSFSKNLHYYILLALFTLLFVLQIWAMLKIKLMLRSVLEIYRRMQQIIKPQQINSGTGSPAQPSSASGVNYRRICMYCRHRETFIDTSGKNVFLFRCGLSQQQIKLDDFCHYFEFDPQRAEI